MLQGMANLVFAAIVFAGAFIGARQGLTFSDMAPWTIGAVLVAAIIRAIVLKSFPKQLWGPGTIAPRDKRQTGASGDRAKD